MRHVSSTKLFLITLLAFVLAYYGGTLLHEWAHGTTAWIFGQKSSPFAVDYGHGWFLRGVDENVDYNQLLAQGKGTAAALIGISGVIVDVLFVLLFFVLLNRPSIRNKPLLLSFSYWSLVMYIPLPPQWHPFGLN